MAEPALLLIGHGSRVAEAAEEMRLLTTLLRERVTTTVAHGWIELAEPRAAEAARDLAAAGHRSVTFVPLLAFSAYHTTVDVPEAAQALRADHPDVDIALGGALGADPRMLALAARRVQAAGEVGALVVVASGTSDEGVQAEIAEVAQRVGVAAAVPVTAHAFASLAAPGVAAALDGLPPTAQRIALFSWSLLDGRLSRGALATAEQWAAANGRTLLDAGRFGPDPVVADVLADRYRDAVPLR